MQYKRILLKLSGEALMGERQYGIDPKRLAEYAQDIKIITEKGIEVAIVEIYLEVLQVLVMAWIECKLIIWACSPLLLMV